MASKNEDTIKLAGPIQNLPRELYDAIYDLTFTIDATNVIITRELRPPARLHVDSASRKLLASRYYQDTIFYFRESSSETLIDWMQSLPAQHRELLGHVRWDWQPTADDSLEYRAALLYLTEEADAEFRGTLRQRACFYVEIRGQRARKRGRIMRRSSWISGGIPQCMALRTKNPQAESSSRLRIHIASSGK